jgi:hypothetical protein
MNTTTSHHLILPKYLIKVKGKRKKNFKKVRMGGWGKRFYLFIFFSGNGKLKSTFKGNSSLL